MDFSNNTFQNCALRLENINRNCLKVIFALMLFCSDVILHAVPHFSIERVNTVNILYIYSYYQAPHFINTKAPKFQLILSQWTSFIKLNMNTFLGKSFIEVFMTKVVFMKFFCILKNKTVSYISTIEQM